MNDFKLLKENTIIGKNIEFKFINKSKSHDWADIILPKIISFLMKNNIASSDINGIIKSINWLYDHHTFFLKNNLSHEGHYIIRITRHNNNCLLYFAIETSVAKHKFEWIKKQIEGLSNASQLELKSIYKSQLLENELSDGKLSLLAELFLITKSKVLFNFEKKNIGTIIEIVIYR